MKISMNISLETINTCKELLSQLNVPIVAPDAEAETRKYASAYRELLSALPRQE